MNIGDLAIDKAAHENLLAMADRLRDLEGPTTVLRISATSESCGRADLRSASTRSASRRLRNADSTTENMCSTSDARSALMSTPISPSNGLALQLPGLRPGWPEAPGFEAKLYHGR